MRSRPLLKTDRSSSICRTTARLRHMSPKTMLIMLACGKCKLRKTLTILQ